MAAPPGGTADPPGQLLFDLSSGSLCFASPASSEGASLEPFFEACGRMTEAIALLLNSIFTSSSTLSTIASSLTAWTVPRIPPMVTTRSFFLIEESIACVSFCFLFCGRMMRK